MKDFMLKMVDCVGPGGRRLPDLLAMVRTNYGSIRSTFYSTSTKQPQPQLGAAGVCLRDCLCAKGLRADAPDLAELCRHQDCLKVCHARVKFSVSLVLIVLSAWVG